MGLKAYDQKRNFRKTVEPPGKVKRTETGRLYVIQKHDASRLHYDFRLELDGVLLSWAVPKGPSYDPHEKRLAVQVEDHPVDYGDFEGIIPEGEYGGGTVMLWDRGTWIPLGDARAMLKEGVLKFELEGEKLKGKWALIRMGWTGHQTRGAGEKNQWLLIKEKDERVRPLKEYDVTAAEARSVASGRSLEEITQQQDRVWNSNRAPRSEPEKIVGLKLPKQRKAAAKTKRIDFNIAEVQGAKKGTLPKLLAPQLATLVDAAPTGDEWLHEIKYDGYRMLCFVESGKARLVSRNGKDWSAKFPGLIERAGDLPIGSALFDGEVVVLTPEGLSKFSAIPDALQGRIKSSFSYFIFDLPWCEGYDLTRATLLERKRILKHIVDAAEPSPAGEDALRYSEHIAGSGPAVYENACRLGMEGIICKRAVSPYTSARNKDWLKVKCAKRQEFVIGGWSEPDGARIGFGALLLGVYDGDDLHYAGRVGTGFSDELLRSLKRRFKQLETNTTAFVNPPRGREARGVHWLRPELVCEVSFTEWIDDHSPRHPSFQGLREDKEPKQVRRETIQATAKTTNRDKAAPPLDHISALSSGKPERQKENQNLVPDKQADPPPRRREARKSETVTIAGITLSNPDRVLYPDQNVTKRKLAEYYEVVGEWMLPHIVGRPLSLVRCPAGWNAKCFFQKHLNDTMPDVLRGIDIAENNETEVYILADNLAGVIALVQMGVLEMHPWGSREGHIEQPDRVVMDLDPDEGLPWQAVLDGAHLLRDELENLGLKSWLKTSGGKGLHIVVPLTPRDDWEMVKAFAKALTDRVVAREPQKYIGTMSKQKRKGKIYIDYLRNSRGATSVAAYSTRARAGAPVSAPIAWEELTADLRPDAFTIENMPTRLAKLKHDPWAELARTRQSLTAAIRRELKLS